MPIIKRTGRPSYGRGFARSASESEAPGLWKGLKGLWLPTLGSTDLILRDHSGFGRHGTLSDRDMWVVEQNGPAINSSGVGHGIVIPTVDWWPSVRGTFVINLIRHGTILANGVLLNIENATNNAVSEVSLAELAGDLIHVFNRVQVAVRWNWGTLTTVLPIGEYVSVVVTWDQPTSAKAGYRNGLPYGSAEGGAWDVNAFSGSETVSIGGRATSHPGNDFSAHSFIDSCWVYNRVLAPAEIKQLSDQPAAMFTRRRRIYASAGVAAFGGSSQIIGGGILSC